MKHDPVNHPSHYTSHPSGVECLDIVEHMNFCLGNAIKYIWRADLKNDKLEDLKKARFYLDREIRRLELQIPKDPKTKEPIKFAPPYCHDCDAFHPVLEGCKPKANIPKGGIDPDVLVELSQKMSTVKARSEVVEEIGRVLTNIGEITSEELENIPI